MPGQSSTQRSAKPQRAIQARSQGSRQWVPWFVLLVSLGMSAIATAYVMVTTDAKDRSRFHYSVERVSSSIDARIQTYITALRATTGLFVSAHDISREQFHRFVERLDVQRRFAGIQG